MHFAVQCGACSAVYPPVLCTRSTALPGYEKKRSVSSVIFNRAAKSLARASKPSATLQKGSNDSFVPGAQVSISGGPGFGRPAAERVSKQENVNIFLFSRMIQKHGGIPSSDPVKLKQIKND